jgi:hypothetical protein
MFENIIRKNQASRLETKFDFNQKISKEDDLQKNWIIKDSIHSLL